MRIAERSIGTRTKPGRSKFDAVADFKQEWSDWIENQGDIYLMEWLGHCEPGTARMCDPEQGSDREITKPKLKMKPEPDPGSGTGFGSKHD